MGIDFADENFTHLTNTIKSLVKSQTEGQGDFTIEICDSIQLKISIKVNHLSTPVLVNLVNLKSGAGSKGSGTLQQLLHLVFEKAKNISKEAATGKEN